jgi:hypothetical protein
VNQLQLRGQQAFELTRGVATLVLDRLVLLGPEKLKGGDRDHGNPAVVQGASHPPNRSAVVGNVLEHVEQAEHVDRPGKRLGDRMLNHLGVWVDSP